MKQESLKQLNKFIEKADRVARSNYWKEVANSGGTTIKFEWIKDVGGKFSDNFPDEEAIDAMVLTARMFIQNNDSISFGSLANLLQDPDVSPGWKSRFTEVRAALNENLDKPTILNIDGKQYTGREIFEVFVYGNMAHTNKDKAKLYDLWKANPLTYPMVAAQFHWTVSELLSAVKYLRHFSEKEINGEEILPPAVP